MPTYGDEDGEDDEDAEHGHGAGRERRHDLAERVELACGSLSLSPFLCLSLSLSLSRHLVELVTRLPAGQTAGMRLFDLKSTLHLIGVESKRASTEVEMLDCLHLLIAPVDRPTLRLVGVESTDGRDEQRLHARTHWVAACELLPTKLNEYHPTIQGCP
jgi:hypothetical protein